MPIDVILPKACADETIGDSLQRSGVSRRDFISLCSMVMAAAPLSLGLTEKVKSAEQLANVVAKAKKPSVIWLHFQDCTGCSETLLRTSRPDVADLILNVISLDYHETLMAASGHQAEKSLKDAMAANLGKYILVCEGSIPTKDGGEYLYLAGQKGIDRLKDVASKSAAIISMGSCASWGGVPSADPNPTGATGVDQIISDKPDSQSPRMPTEPVQPAPEWCWSMSSWGRLPALDQLGRPNRNYEGTESHVENRDEVGAGCGSCRNPGDVCTSCGTRAELRAARLSGRIQQWHQ